MADPWVMLALPPLDSGLLKGVFASLPIEVVVPEARTTSAVLAAASRAEIILGDWSGATMVSAELIAAAPRLAFVQQPSVGVDKVDVEACTAAGIPVANAGDANAVSVAEWCVGSAFAILRSLAHGDREIRAGRWPQLDLARRGGGELSGRRVGIIGMGTIARACAQRFVALGCDVAHWSRTERPPAEAGGARWMPFEALLSRTDVLVVLVALAPQTTGLLSAEQLAMLPPGAFVINAARGGIVDEAALLAAIDSGALAGGALDVYETEPLPADSPLLTQDRLLLSPHAGGATREAQGNLIATTVANIGRAVAGDAIENVVNGPSVVIQRQQA